MDVMFHGWCAHSTYTRNTHTSMSMGFLWLVEFSVCRIRIKLLNVIKMQHRRTAVCWGFLKCHNKHKYANVHLCIGLRIGKITSIQVLGYYYSCFRVTWRLFRLTAETDNTYYHYSIYTMDCLLSDACAAGDIKTCKSYFSMHTRWIYYWLVGLRTLMGIRRCRKLQKTFILSVFQFTWFYEIYWWLSLIH